MRYIFSSIALLLVCISFGQKKVLDHTVYDDWQSIKDVVFQPQGNLIAYTVTPQEGDAILYIKDIKSHWELAIPRGSQASFSENGQLFIAKIKASFIETRKAKIEKKKADELPKDSLFIYDINTKTSQIIPSVKSYQLPEKANNIIAYLMDKKGDINKEGSELIIYNFKTLFKQRYTNVSQYAINPNGQQLIVYQVPNKNNPAQVLLANANDSTFRKISTHLYSATGFIWDEIGEQAAYYIEPDSTSKALQKKYQLAYFKLGMDSSDRVLTSSNTLLPNNYVFGADKKLNFSKSGKVLELGIQPILPIKDTSLPEFDRVSVDIWHYNDPSLQPMQLKNIDAQLKNTELVLYRPKDRSINYLGKISERDIRTTYDGDGRWAYATIDSAHLKEVQWKGYAIKDIYAINTHTGEKRIVQNKWKGNLLSPNYSGSKLVYYDEPSRKYFSYDANSNRSFVIAKDIKWSLFDEDNDVPDDPNAYGIAKWMEDQRHLIIYDRYDLWLVDADGIEPSKLLTNGRAIKTVYRFNETISDRKFLNNNALILLRGYNEVSKSESLSSLLINTRTLTLLNQFPMHLSNIVAARESSDFIALQEDEKSAANIFAYKLNANAQAPVALTAINPQQAEYNWLSSEIVKWKSYTGKITEGVLYKPENFDPKKKYPMIVYFYERNNQTLHNYIPPAPTGSRLNISFFASRGYLVFVPDIWYTKGYPGQSAYDYIVSGTKAMIQKGYVDSTKIGLQGQSWGGYQIAYLITKTNMYTAAWAGAPVVNMTSAYGGIRWGTGMNRQFQYEKTQSRIGATLWERPDLYIKNSALFELPKVQTPLVIMSNDADDAVPWYQGIEMFTAMKRLDKKVWLLVYNNEFHNLVERRNKKDIQVREQQFFDHYLQGAPIPIWMSKGVPAIMKGRTMGLDY